MEPKWIEPYNLMLLYQEFLLLLIALMGSLACLGALASLLFIWRECFVGLSRRGSIGLGVAEWKYRSRGLAGEVGCERGRRAPEASPGTKTCRVGSIGTGVLSRLILDYPLAPLGGEGGERSEPGEGVGMTLGVAQTFASQKVCGLSSEEPQSSQKARTLRYRSFLRFLSRAGGGIAVS